MPVLRTPSDSYTQNDDVGHKNCYVDFLLHSVLPFAEKERKKVIEVKKKEEWRCIGLGFELVTS